MTTQNKVHNIIAQPSTNSGELKTKVWTTSMANAIDSGELVFEVLEGHCNITVDGKSYKVSQEAAYSSALFQAYGAKSVGITKLLEMLEQDCLSSNQFTAKNHIESNGLTPIAKEGRVLTAEQYLTNAYVANLDKKNLDHLAAVMMQANKLSEKSTKTDLLDCLRSFQHIFITEKQQESYEIIAENDRQDAKRFEGLKDAGFENIARSSTFLSANISLADSATGLPKLAELGYTFTGSDLDSETLIFTVRFSEETSETEPEL